MYGNRVKSCERKKQPEPRANLRISIPESRMKNDSHRARASDSNNSLSVFCLQALKVSAGKSYGVAKR